MMWGEQTAITGKSLSSKIQEAKVCTRSTATRQAFTGVPAGTRKVKGDIVGIWDEGRSINAYAAFLMNGWGDTL